MCNEEVRNRRVEDDNLDAVTSASAVEVVQKFGDVGGDIVVPDIDWRVVEGSADDVWLSVSVP